MDNKRFLAVLTGLALVLALFFVGCSPAAPDDEPDVDIGDEEPIDEFKVAFVYVGPTGDAGWTYRHDEGRKYLESKLDFVTTSYVEAVEEGADAERVIGDFARQGYDLIFATAAGYLDFTLELARRYPDTVFINTAAWATDEPNLGQFYGRLDEGRYLTGIVAGMMTETDIIGFVAAHPIPGVIFGINAFAMGVQSVNPDAEIKVAWTNTWYNPDLEKQAALSLIDVGADVIAQHQDTPSPLMAAAERGVYGIGSESDMSQFAPDAYLTGTIWDWGEYYVKTVEAVRAGTWQPGYFWGNLADGMVKLGPFGPMVPEEVKTAVEEAKQKIISGELEIFEGPIKDRSGEVRIPDGVVPPFEEIYNHMDWLTVGITAAD